MSDMTSTIHMHSYPAISPTNPALSQAGRTVLITGGSGGIGFAIARSFVAASASRVIITGRHQAGLDGAAAVLKESAPASSTVEIQTRAVDNSDGESILNLWKGLKRDGIAVDVLVHNVASTSPNGFSKNSPGVEENWRNWTQNTKHTLLMAEAFLGQGKKGEKVLAYVSTAAIHMNMGGVNGVYKASKLAATAALQCLADEVPVEEARIVAFHPGAVFTAGAKEAGFEEKGFPWDNADLPGDFAVWLSSKEASFLHGRFLWSAWDVDELKSMKEKIVAEPGLLRVGVNGIKPTSMAEAFAYRTQSLGMSVA